MWTHEFEEHSKDPNDLCEKHIYRVLQIMNIMLEDLDFEQNGRVHVTNLSHGNLPNQCFTHFIQFIMLEEAL